MIPTHNCATVTQISTIHSYCLIVLDGFLMGYTLHVRMNNAEPTKNEYENILFPTRIIMFCWNSCNTI